MKQLTFIWILFLSIPSVFSQSVNVTFNQDEESWKACYINYLEEENLDSLTIDDKPTVIWSNLPYDLNAQSGMKFVGSNDNPDFFLFIEKEIEGLTPNRSYKIIVNTDWVYHSFPDDHEIAVKVGAAKESLEKTERLKKLQHFGTLKADGEKVNIKQNIHNYPEPLVVSSNDSGYLWISVGLLPNQAHLDDIHLNTLRLVFIEDGEVDEHQIDPSEIGFRADDEESMIYFDSEYNDQIERLYIYTENKDLLKAYIFESPNIKKAFEIGNLGQGTYWIEFVFDNGQSVMKTYVVD